MIAAFIKSHAPHVARVGLETGATATWLWTELNKLGLPVICIDARHAKAALKMQINKSDRNDAVGLARVMQCSYGSKVAITGWSAMGLERAQKRHGERRDSWLIQGRDRRLGMFPSLRVAGASAVKISVVILGARNASRKECLTAFG